MLVVLVDSVAKCGSQILGQACVPVRVTIIYQAESLRRSRTFCIFIKSTLYDYPNNWQSMPINKLCNELNSFYVCSISNFLHVQLTPSLNHRVAVTRISSCFSDAWSVRQLNAGYCTLFHCKLSFAFSNVAHQTQNARKID